MVYLLISILVFTGILLLANRLAKRVLVCPICGATVITWAGAILGGLYLNWFPINPLFIAILVGISLGASIEKFGSRFGLPWKVAMVLLGAPAIFFLLQKQLLYALYLLLALVLATALASLKFSRKPAKGAYKEVIKDCCN